MHTHWETFAWGWAGGVGGSGMYYNIKIHVLVRTTVRDTRTFSFSTKRKYLILDSSSYSIQFHCLYRHTLPSNFHMTLLLTATISSRFSFCVDATRTHRLQSDECVRGYDLLEITFKSSENPHRVEATATPEWKKKTTKTNMFSNESIIIILNEYKLIFYRIKYL